MTVTNPDHRTTVRFLIDDAVFETEVRRGQILHEAVHEALPAEYTAGTRLTFSSATGMQLFADNFVGDIADSCGTTDVRAVSVPIAGLPGSWRTLGFDHLAISVADRGDAMSFFRDVAGMKVMRDDRHLTVLSGGHTALFLFDAGSDEPLSPDRPSSWHHIGFVVDDLEHAYAHLRDYESRLRSDFTLLERDERWSLYFFYQNGDVTFMIQFSEIKPDWRGIAEHPDGPIDALLYDYSSRPYGVQFDDNRS